MSQSAIKQVSFLQDFDALTAYHSGMDIYHIWCDLKPGVSDLAFSRAASAYLDHLKEETKLEGWRMTRRKLGLGIEGLGEFHLMLEFKNLQQLDDAFNSVASRKNPVESFHHAVNSLVKSVQFSLYRDFPDAGRHEGDEKF